MSVAVEDFPTEHLMFWNRFWICTRKERSVWIDPVYFCYFQFFNNRAYLPEEKSTKSQLREQPREKNLSFVLMPSPDSASNLKENHIIAVGALRIIEREEMYIDMGSEYSFSQLRTQLTKATKISTFVVIFTLFVSRSKDSKLQY